MRRLILLSVLLLAGPIWAIGPVGRYLGYQLELQAVTQGWAKDSLHLTLPTPFDTVVYAVSQDTAVLDSETIYRGLPGYLFRHSTWTNGSPAVSWDTCYESTGVYLKQRQALGDSHLSVVRYAIPFAVNSWWRTGTEGVYPIDFGHNDTIDTVAIWADTSRVIGQEDVTTPYGTVHDCYKIRTHSHWCIVTYVSGIPSRDSMDLIDYEWYKDSLWSVKDSSYSFGKISIYLLGFWLRAGNNTTFGVKELAALGASGIGAGSASPGRSLPITSGPNPFRTDCVIRTSGPQPSDPLRIEIFDASGRRVFAARVRDQVVWRPIGAPSGVYRLVIRDHNDCRDAGHLVYLGQ